MTLLPACLKPRWYPPPSASPARDLRGRQWLRRQGAAATFVGAVGFPARRGFRCGRGISPAAVFRPNPSIWQRTGFTLSASYGVLTSSIAGFAAQQPARVQPTASYHDVYHIYACSETAVTPSNQNASPPFIHVDSLEALLAQTVRPPSR